MTPVVEELPDNRVRLTVDVPREDVHHAVEHAASDLAASVKVPGFRKGKVPMPVLVSRIGKERIYAEAVESHISGWFWDAAARSGIRPADGPELEYELPVSDDEDWRFTATVPVLAKPELPDWTTLEVARPDVEVPGELVEAELEALRSTVAALSPVTDRPAQPGDTVVVDLVRDGGDAQRDYVVELGSGRLVPELEQQLVGMSAGESREVRFELADEQLAVVDATVKEIKEKVLPPVDDELARTASEFDTIDELRADVEGRLREQIEAEVDEAFRRAALDAVVDATDIDPSGPIVDARTRTLLRELDEVMRRRGASLDTYIEVTGGSAEELVGRLYQEAKHSVAGELVLEAAADKLAIDVSDEDVDASIRERFEEPELVLEQLREGGAYERERESMRMARALDRIVAEVKPIPLEQAEAREAIWTPDKEKPKTETKLWTPGSKEPA
ncbi:MAG TPA: trigger factor [Gaiellaceae bacterium]|nr:trigger factor [Gaiellaceae bacterium]